MISFENFAKQKISDSSAFSASSEILLTSFALKPAPFFSSGENFATIFDNVFSSFKSFPFQKFSKVVTPLAIVEISF